MTAGEGYQNQENILIATSLLSWVVLVTYPLFIYSWYQLYRHQQKRYFVKRNVRLIFVGTIYMFLHNGIAVPIEILQDDLKLLPLPTTIIPEIFEKMMDGSLFFGVILTMILRLWLVNFHHQLQLQIAAASWKQELLVNKNIKPSFYTRYKNSLGSVKYLSKVIGSCYIIIYIALITIDIAYQNSSFSEAINDGVLFSGYILAIAFCIIIWCKFPAFKDNLFIRQELKESFIFLIFILMFGVAVWIITEHFTIIHNILQLTVMLPVDGLLFLAVARVVQLNTKGKKQIIKQNTQGNNDFTLARILMHKIGYTEFMQFLVKEFASECCLAFTDLLQFKQWIFKYNANVSKYKQDSIEQTSICNNRELISLPYDMPKWYLIYDMKDKSEQEMIAQCMKLVMELRDKYLCDGCKWEINISYRMKQKFEKFIKSNMVKKDIKLETFYELFDDIINEMFSLMMSSFTHFVETSDFEQVKINILEQVKSKIPLTIKIKSVFAEEGKHKMDTNQCDEDYNDDNEVS
eukprot:425201_1